MAAIFLATTALTTDQPPRFEPGEWQFEVQQGGGASFKDSKSKDPSGTSSISEERPKQVGKRCIKRKDAQLTPGFFVPGCSASNVTYTANQMKADLACANPSMPMTGSITMTLADEGKSISGFQIVSGGGDAVGAVMTTSIKMTHLGKCK